MSKQESFPVEPEEYFNQEEAAKSQSQYLKEELKCEIEDAENEAHRNAAEMQAVKFEIAVLKLLRRTNGNTEISNAINQFIDALTHQAGFGRDDKQLGGVAQRDLVEFFTEKAEELRWDIGGHNRPADKKPTWTRKREKE